MENYKIKKYPCFKTKQRESLNYENMPFEIQAALNRLHTNDSISNRYFIVDEKNRIIAHVANISLRDKIKADYEAKHEKDLPVVYLEDYVTYKTIEAFRNEKLNREEEAETL